MLHRNPHQVTAIMNAVHRRHLQSLFGSYPLLASNIGGGTQTNPCHNIIDILKCAPLLVKPVQVSSELKWYKNYVLKQRPIFDGDEQICVDSVAAIAGKHGAIWFGRVVQVDQEEVKVQYFNCDKSSKWYELLPYQGEIVHRECIICNGIELEPTQKEHPCKGTVWKWRLMIPRSIIKAMNSNDNQLFLRPAESTINAERRRNRSYLKPVWEGEAGFLQMIDNISI